MFFKNSASKTAENWISKARISLQNGKALKAIKYCHRALESEPNSHDAHSLLSRAMMPGMSYHEILTRIHRELKPATYVEIGVREGGSLSKAQEGTMALGIDPCAQIKQDISARYKLFNMTSDQFFRDHNVFEELEQERLDLAFIDGLHIFEQALKDFINLERYANPETIILLHDCYPPSEIGARRKRVTDFWTGDVWKMIPCLKALRPDLKIHVIPTAPSGIGIITNADPNSTLLQDNFAAITQKYVKLPYATLMANRDRQLNIIDNTWDTISKLIRCP